MGTCRLRYAIRLRMLGYEILELITMAFNLCQLVVWSLTLELIMIVAIGFVFLSIGCYGYKVKLAFARIVHHILLFKTNGEYHQKLSQKALLGIDSLRGVARLVCVLLWSMLLTRNDGPITDRFFFRGLLLKILQKFSYQVPFTIIVLSRASIRCLHILSDFASYQIHYHRATLSHQKWPASSQIVPRGCPQTPKL